MSLINDALKRAHAASKNAPANPNVTIRLQPTEEANGHSMLLMVGLPLLIVALLLGGGWYYFYGRPGAPRLASLNRSQPIQAAAVPAAPPVAATPAAVSPTPAAPTAATPAPAPDQTEVAANPAPAAPAPAIVLKPVAAKKAPAAAPAAAKAAPVFPPLKLQGIYFRRTNPSAMINNQNVGIGESVDGVQVIAIERMVVTVELDGQKKVLNLQ